MLPALCQPAGKGGCRGHYWKIQPRLLANHNARYTFTSSSHTCIIILYQFISFSFSVSQRAVTNAGSRTISGHNAPRERKDQPLTETPRETKLPVVVNQSLTLSLSQTLHLTLRPHRLSTTITSIRRSIMLSLISFELPYYMKFW